MAAGTAQGAAWGLELGGSCLRLACVERTAEGFRVREFHQQPLEGRWDPSADPAGAMAQLARAKVAPPLAVAIPDELVMFRCQSLPQAGADDTARMVRAQIEAMLPTQGQDFASAWAGGDEPGPAPGRPPGTPALMRILLCAARATEVDRARRLCGPLGCPPEQVIPSAWALAAAHGLGPRGDECMALLDVAARTTTLIVLDGGGVAQCILIDQGGDHWTERIAQELGLPVEQAEQAKLAWSRAPAHPPADAGGIAELMRTELGRWAGQVHEAYSAARADPGSPGPYAAPRRCLLTGGAARTPGLAEAAGQALGLEMIPAAAPARIALPMGLEFAPAAAAIGAALRALDGRAAALNLAPPPAVRRRAIPKVSRAWVGVGAWILGAIVLLYALDSHRAASLRATLDRITAEAAADGGLGRRLAIAALLQPTAAEPLALLDELSAAAPKEVMLTSLDYARDGHVAFAGVVPNEQVFHALLEKLRESRAFAGVGYSTIRKDKDKFRFEITVRAGRTGRQPAYLPEAGRPAATQPGPGPTSGPPGAATSAPAGEPGAGPAGGAGAQGAAPASAPASPEMMPTVSGPRRIRIRLGGDT